MQPNHYDLLGQAQDEPRFTPGRVTRDALQSRSGVPSRSEDSWIEVSSQPSSSSLSSAATTDDIITTGLRVQQTESGQHHRRDRRRRLQRLAAVTTAQVEYSSHEPSSSQDEYEESESESDRVMTSSNEDIVRPSLVMGPSLSTAPDVCPSSDEDDSSTALGMRVSASPFVPQPNAFSHPPASENPSWTGRSTTSRSRPISDVSTSSRRTAIRRNSQQASSRASQRLSNQQHSPYNVISPSHHADHDAALRASLSTLLSCAAAARGLPKSDAQPTSSGPSRVQPASFRLVSESMAMDEEVEKDVLPNTEVPTPPRARGAWQAQQAPSPYSPREISSGRTKRRSSTSKDRGSNHSVAKKSRRTGTTESSSAVMTWVISAGVVVLFSAISFSAGYVLGREVGRLEAGTGMGSVLGHAASPSSRASAACGQEAVHGGLKRFRWSPGAAGSGVIS